MRRLARLLSSPATDIARNDAWIRVNNRVAVCDCC
jgi:hypothetical protein